ncbi:MAG: putative metal-binding motif-containing protein [Saprospiraceae bacterium]
MIYLKLSKVLSSTVFKKQNLKICLAICCLQMLVAIPAAMAQLNADGDLYKISQSGTYHDETIPSGGGLNGNNYLTFTLKGGDGGAYKGIFNERKGGGGATVRASFQIGTGAGQLQPGGVVRFVVGHHGSTIRRGIISGAGGGGGTAVLYHHPSATITCTDPSTDLADANSCWVILAVAGGGGGAYASDIAGSGSNGKNATGGECGLPGLGSGHGEGGCNGNGGESGNDGVTNTGGGGGGALTDGLGGDGTGGNAGGFTGGEGGDDYINGGKGGFGYGGGGYGVGAGHPSGGGGGGGYSGGGGAYTNPGGGGGSFANDDAEEVDKKDGKVDSSPDHGKVHYQFAVKDGPTAKCKDVEVTLVNGSATIHVNDVNNGSFAEPDNFVLEKLFVPSETLTLTFDCSHVGDNTVQLSIKSTTQKYDYCTATVEVLDEVPPTINCITETIGVELDANFEYVLSVAEIESGTASDACGMVVDKYLHNDTLTCDSIGTRTVYLTAEDDNGNTSFCSATVNVLPSTTANSRFYVDANATGSNDGSSWTNAFNLLQDALAASQICQNPTDIWVADGTYYPDEGGGNTDNNRQSTFTIYPNVSLYGGFAGGETSLSQRNWETNVAILSGDLMQDDGADFASNGDNAYHVVSGQGDLTGNTLDGFTITAGNANVSQFVKSGAGIYLQQNGGLTISNCKVIANKADITGAGLYIVNSNTTSVQVVNCWFGGNRAGGSGGGVYIGGQGTSADFINVLFSGNWSPKGSAVAATGALSNTNLINCTVAANNSTTGAALYHNDSNVTTFNIINSIVWGNESAFTAESGAIFNVNYSIVQGGFTGTDNLDTNPIFLDLPDYNSAPTTTGDFHLQNCSPAIDAGTSTGAPTDDLVDAPRPANAGYDMGAYEHQGSPSPGITCYADTDGDNYGDAAVTQVFCGSRRVRCWQFDCDDTESAKNPSFTEICDGIDNNCNSQTDETEVCCPAGNVICRCQCCGRQRRQNVDGCLQLFTGCAGVMPTCSGVTEIWVADGIYYPDEGAA